MVHFLASEVLFAQEMIINRFLPPPGYSRISSPSSSFGNYLQSLPLKPAGTRVKYYDNRLKAANVYDAVVDLDIGKKDLQQCADAVIRLRAEFLYKHQKHEDITFNFTNGFKADYKKWIQGYRIAVHGNDVKWVLKSTAGDNYSIFREYLETVFMYAGALSLSKSMPPKPVRDMKTGDVFIQRRKSRPCGNCGRYGSEFQS